ncbi:hypothetical protein HCU64_19025 [Methylobacterium sp. C25]|uniref:hypothetical protein n=1 Tax=Methylobacterium sp. C25 TaxID=2721622 RepID=UPI001F4053AC|nr:hypothetical protein [Methylobacterium sp. C25]MCE4225849.1 hypothetical protein [Methylobacterium sp. C25]
MPVIGAVIGAIMTGLLYWFMYGNGMEQIERLLGDRRNHKLRLKSEANFKAAPIRSIKNPADAAGVLMQLVAQARGTPTPEQEAAIEEQMRTIIGSDDDLATQMVFIRHAATQAADAETAIDHLAPLLREKLTVSERDDVERMLEAVAVIHQGPTDRQERLIARTVRVLAELA